MKRNALRLRTIKELEKEIENLQIQLNELQGVMWLLLGEITMIREMIQQSKEGGK
jgi:hypothetical protein